MNEETLHKKIIGLLQYSEMGHIQLVTCLVRIIASVLIVVETRMRAERNLECANLVNDTAKAIGPMLQTFCEAYRKQIENQKVHSA